MYAIQNLVKRRNEDSKILKKYKKFYDLIKNQLPHLIDDDCCQCPFYSVRCDLFDKPVIDYARTDDCIEIFGND